jgi:hypothetical protein
MSFREGIVCIVDSFLYICYITYTDYFEIVVQVVQYLTQCNSSRDPKRGLGGVGHAATSGYYPEFMTPYCTVYTDDFSIVYIMYQEL